MRLLPASRCLTVAAVLAVTSVAAKAAADPGSCLPGATLDGVLQALAVELREPELTAPSNCRTSERRKDCSWTKDGVQVHVAFDGAVLGIRVVELQRNVRTLTERNAAYRATLRIVERMKGRIDPAVLARISASLDSKDTSRITDSSQPCLTYYLASERGRVLGFILPL